MLRLFQKYRCGSRNWVEKTKKDAIYAATVNVHFSRQFPGGGGEGGGGGATLSTIVEFYDFFRNFPGFKKILDVFLLILKSPLFPLIQTLCTCAAKIRILYWNIVFPGFSVFVHDF